MEPKMQTLSQIHLQDGEAYYPFHSVAQPEDYRFVIDIYSADGHIHPDLHLGWWAWPAKQAVVATSIRLVYRSQKVVDVFLICDEGELTADEQWVNTEYHMTPRQNVQLIWYDPQHEAQVQQTVTMNVIDEHLLQDYYADNARRYAIVHPWGNDFHQRRLDVLKRLFIQYIKPGSCVLDVGSGHSMFYLIGGDSWPFHITCLDLDRALMKQVAQERPRYSWMVAALQKLPFADASFDALYAGEVIEHVPDGNAALAEWYRVLRPNGTLIVTTPNRRRLLNRINSTTIPVSPEHLIEFTCNELSTMFVSNGFKVVQREGIYLELLSLWRQRAPYIDPLVVPNPLRRHLWVSKPLQALGRPFPQFALDMVFVGRKRP
jgi:ubiquinone/menaquinone biosynthesis C-methylase UbiE